MLEWATLGPASGHLHLLLILLRMPCPQIFMTGSFCQSGLCSNAPLERPFMTTLTEVVLPAPHYSFQLVNFLCSSYYSRTLPYLSIYLHVCWLLSPCQSCFLLYPQHLEQGLTHSRCLVNIILIHQSVAELRLECRLLASWPQDWERNEMGKNKHIIREKVPA